MKKSITAMLILCFSAAICLSLSACGAGKTGGDSAVVFLNGDADLAAGYQEIAEKYEKEKGVKVTVINADRQNYTETLKTELKKSNAPTLFTLDTLFSLITLFTFCAVGHSKGIAASIGIVDRIGIDQTIAADLIDIINTDPIDLK